MRKCREVESKAHGSRIHRVPPSARQLKSISQFDICDLRLRQVLLDLMEKVAACLDVQEVELVELEEEVKKLVAEEDLLVLDPPEDLIKARVENEKLKYVFCDFFDYTTLEQKPAALLSIKRYQLNILKRAVAKELGEKSKGNMCCLSSNALILQTSNWGQRGKDDCGCKNKQRFK